MRNISPLRQRLPLVGLLIAAIFGILLASWLGMTGWLAASLFVAWMLLLPLRREGAHCWVLTAAVFAMMQIWSWQEAPARKLSLLLDSHRCVYAVEGIVEDEPRISPSGSASFTMRVERIAENDAEEQVTTIPVTVQVRWEGEVPAYGDRVRFHGEGMRPPPPRNPGAFDYRWWLERHGVYTEFRIDPSQPGSIMSRGHGNPMMALAISARHRMERILEAGMGDALAVLSAIKGITLGVTESAPEGFTDDFRFTGTMHLFSVSGLHVGMLAVIIWFVLKAARLPRSWAVAVTIPALFFYVAVTGLKSGSIRSATMASILLCGMVLFRRAPMLNTLAASALLQLALDTNTLFSAGWQFSYAVVFAILAAAPPLETWLRERHAPDPFLPRVLLTRGERIGYGCWNHIAGLAGVSAAAWIGALIPTAAYFHLVSLSALGANLLAVPLAFCVLSLAALSLLSGGFSLWVAGAFNNANWLVTKLLLTVVQAWALIPGGHWFVGMPGKPYPVMTILDLRGGSCAVVRSGGGFALVDAGRRKDASPIILPFLESSGANSIASALITRADAAHLGGFPEIGRELSVERVAIPPLPPLGLRSQVARSVVASLRHPRELHAGEDWPMTGKTRAEILNPRAGVSGEMLVTRIHLGNLRILMLPRLTPESSRQLLETISPETLRSEVLLFPLGGAEMTSTLRLIRAVGPRVLVTPVGGIGRDAFPGQEWDGVLSAEGITLMRQDETGAVILEADPKAPKAVPFLNPDQPVPTDRVHRSDSKKAFD